MLKAIKSNSLIRKFLFGILSGKIVSRSHYVSSYKISFDAGRNMGFFFSRSVHWEPVITKNVLNLLKTGMTVFDIGGNIGYYTILFADAVGTKGKVVTFEPDEISIPILKTNINQNQLMQVTLVAKGISSTKGTIKFNLDMSTGQTSSIKDDVWHPNATQLKTVEIETMSLDNALEIYGCPHFIKCDVEGAEELVFNKESARKTLSKKPILLIEIKDENQVLLYE
ncbi:MAG: FkbM family methyltransferase, partial [Bacteroidota bacterium]